MATTFVTPDQDTIVSEVDIAAPADRVFKGICDAKTVPRGASNLDLFGMDLRVGGEVASRDPNAEAAPRSRGDPPTTAKHSKSILPSLLVYTWFANFHSNPKHRSIVRGELTPTKSGTHVKVTHSGLASEPQACKDYAGRWSGVLDALSTLSEEQSGEFL